MEDIKEMRTLVDKAHREEVKSFNLMTSDEATAVQQQSQLDTCLAYRGECLGGLKGAKHSGLSVLQIRECQILVTYLDSVLKTRQYKVDVSQENFEESKIIWQKKNENYESLKKTLEQREIEDKEKRENQLVGKGSEKKSADSQSEKKKKTYNKKL